MGVATFLIGLLPTYAQSVRGRPVLLVLLRIAQGFGVGGEWGGAVLMAVEHAPPGSAASTAAGRRSACRPDCCSSTVVFALFARLPEDQFLAWGWRVPFLVSILLVGVGLIIRVRILETPAFSKMKERAREARQPILEVLSRVSEASAARHGRALRRERRVLHLHGLRPRLRDAARAHRPQTWCSAAS